jgi:hypothetical protein
MAQTRWTYLNRDYSLLTRVESILLDGHFVVEHGGRSRRGTFFNFNGTAGVWRRAAIDSAGGWEHDTLTEDTDLSYRAQLKGWKFLYLPNVECASELPVDMNGFKAQQARWAKGLMQTAKKILPQVFRSDAPWHVKAEAFFHLTANISYPLMVLFSAMLLPAMIVRFYQGWFQMLLIDLPLFLASTCSISSFYLVAQRELRPKSWWSTSLHAVRDGHWHRHFHSQREAVLEAIFDIKSEFVRTPKFKIESKKDTFVTKNTGTKAGWMPYAEILLGVYFGFTVVYAITNQNFATYSLSASFRLGLSLHGLHVARPNLFPPICASASTPRKCVPLPQAPPVFKNDRLIFSLCVFAVFLPGANSLLNHCLQISSHEIRYTILPVLFEKVLLCGEYPLKSYLPCVALLVFSGILALPQASNVTSVPVEEEPLHKVVFKNDAVTVMHVVLPPGQTTLFHSHTHDRVAIDLSTTAIAQQKINEAEGPSTATKPGNISALTLTDASYTHRVHNVGTAPTKSWTLSRPSVRQLPLPTSPPRSPPKIPARGFTTGFSLPASLRPCIPTCARASSSLSRLST